MAKPDPHLKKQKQIRMTDELRARFDAAQRASGLQADEFVAVCLDALEARGQNQPSNAELLKMLEARLRPDTIKLARVDLKP